MAITIKDIAHLAGVSITTVSKIINKKDHDISEKTRNRVLRVIEEQKYTPNALASGLVTKRTNTLGLLVPDIANAFFAELARAVEDGAMNCGYNVILCNTDENQAKEAEYVEVLRSKRVDGIIFLSTALSNHQVVLDLKDTDLPVVVLDRTIEEEGLMTVSLDNVLGGYMATDHLLEYGHEKIGSITGPLKNDIVKQRYLGYVKALEERGLSPKEDYIFEGDFKSKSGELGAKALVKSGVTAIFAHNDLMAYGVYKVAYELGLNIPQDLSIVGFDDIYTSKALIPPLTSVRQPAHDMGLMAAKILIGGIKGQRPDVVKKEFTPVLSKRKSVASP